MCDAADKIMRESGGDLDVSYFWKLNNPEGNVSNDLQI